MEAVQARLMLVNEVDVAVRFEGGVGGVVSTVQLLVAGLGSVVPFAVAATLKEKFGGLDVAVINAGIAELRPIDKWDPAGVDKTFNINVKGPFFLIQALLPILANPSSIVITASVNAHIGMANTSIYGASKAAILRGAGELLHRIRIPRELLGLCWLTHLAQIAPASTD